ncbi:MAG: hypothetical protein OHK006_23910 [Thermodesulfovibrionales bacterium]
MRKVTLLLAVVLLLGVSALSSAQDFRNIGAEELKKMLDSKKAVAVDARPADEFRQGHIPGAINIPPEKLGSIAGLLPKDKKKALVFYCRGVG